MRKTITYTTFLLAALFVCTVFVTSKSYMQLAIAIALYPFVAYFALHVFPRNRREDILPDELPPLPEQDPSDLEKVEVADFDRRTFLKLVGSLGISVFLFSILGRRADALLFDKQKTTTPDEDIQPNLQDYRISEMDEETADSYFGFTKKGGWLIMKVDNVTNSFRYARGETDFSKNWNSRTKLTYRYFYEL